MRLTVVPRTTRVFSSTKLGTVLGTTVSLVLQVLGTTVGLTDLGTWVLGTRWYWASVVLAVGTGPLWYWASVRTMVLGLRGTRQQQYWVPVVLGGGTGRRLSLPMLA